MPQRQPLTPDVKLSKALSKTLRHQAVKQGFKIDANGFIPVSDLLSHQIFKAYKFEDIERVVQTNDKQRFLLHQNDNGAWLIKANQGHSLTVENADLKPLLKLDDFPAQVIHGTNTTAYDTIKQVGLSRMKRTHIHMAKGKPGDTNVISGIRKSANVFIFIDVEKALAENICFYESKNGVILSAGNDEGYIPVSCFKNVEIIQKN